MMERNRFLVACSAVVIAVGVFLAIMVMPVCAKSVLEPGDIAIIGYAFDNPDTFAFVALVEIDAGTTITFTDNGWYAAGGFRATEGTLVWTAAADIPTGTVVIPSDVGSMAFAASGDQILAYQGPDNNPTFIYALHSNGSTWDADATSSNTSALPTGLTDGLTAVAIPEVDNAVYTGTTFADVPHNAAYFLALIGNPANWQTDDDNRLPMPSTTFTGPNAITLSGLKAHASFSILWSGLALAGLFAGILIVVRRRR